MAKKRAAKKSEAKKTAAVVTTRAEAALALDVSERALRNWERRDDFPGRPDAKGRGGRYPIAEIRVWRDSTMRSATVGGSREPASPRQKAARLSLAESKAGIAQIEFEERARNIVVKADVLRLAQRVVAKFEAVAAALPERLRTALVAGVPLLSPAIGNMAVRIATQECADALAMLREIPAAINGHDPDDETPPANVAGGD